ncbi:MAG TPA: DNA recombination protein RmuC [Candidatus Omnitrophota bacterium]|nr:DNA recombination protein RmuC [Candidatus Omnitrophota bacterium]
MELFTIGLLVLNLALAILLWTRFSRTDYQHHFNEVSKNQERTERIVREDIARNREELRDTLKGFGDSLRQGFESVRESVEKRLEFIQKDNNAKLEQMRQTVDENLHSTLEKRLGESFKLVDEQLSKVREGLGEMRNLAVGVGDLKKVLTNVKTRGTWGEVQLGNLLEQILTPEQFEKNVVTKVGSKDPVEFAILFPEGVRLPIDAKFPVEDYQRLQEAQDSGDKALVEEASKALEQRIKLEAKKIQEKYIDPPHTTDFALMFLPTEGLFAEVIRRPGLCDSLQRDFRIVAAGPTTIAALLNSLQVGFRALTVEKRASEVWQQLGVIRTEFSKFGEILKRTQKKLQEASNTIEEAASKSRTIERKLNKVQELPSTSTVELLEKDPAIDVELEP